MDPMKLVPRWGGRQPGDGHLGLEFEDTDENRAMVEVVMAAARSGRPLCLVDDVEIWPNFDRLMKNLFGAGWHQRDTLSVLGPPEFWTGSFRQALGIGASDDLRRQNADLQAANNRYLERARAAEASRDHAHDALRRVLVGQGASCS